MNLSATILSTKKLTIAQKELVLNTGLGFVEYDGIQIEFLKNKVGGTIQNAIFTSKNAVKSILNTEVSITNCFCVGEKTKKLLEDKGQNVIEMAQNAADLAKKIIKKYNNESFLFLSGNLRRDELPMLLKEHKVVIEEITVYNTHTIEKEFHRNFDGILFFSPSGVQSYTATNSIGNSIVFCIGSTTAVEAKKYTDNIIIANKPTVENVLVQAVNYFDTRI